MHEGRELYVANVDWSATEKEVTDAFARFGEVESVRIPMQIGGKSKGMAFVVFKEKVNLHLEACIYSRLALASDNINHTNNIRVQEAAVKALEMNLTKFKARVISVSPSTNDTAKRRATTIINPAYSRSSHSPTPNPVNGHDAVLPTSEQSTGKSIASSSDRQSRTIAIVNVPDIVTSDRIRVLAEAHGALVKLQLRPDHQGAIIEYADASGAGKAGLALDGHEIQPGRLLRVVTVPELLKQKVRHG